MSDRVMIFEHTDGDEDRIRVEHIEDGVSPVGRLLLIDTRDEQEGDRVQVVLSKDDALRLAKAITDALEPQEPQELTVEQLNAMAEGDKVKDPDGNEWACTSFGDWQGRGSWRDIHAHELVRIYGPITAVQA